MCGITGFWQTRRRDLTPADILDRMASSLFYRGPDDSGAYYDGSSGLGLAFRRLSILDLSPQGHQPMASSSGRYKIVFNGEVYNFQEIRRQLPLHTWRGGSDTEVMLEAFEQWGIEPAVKKFVGMFAFAVWDRAESTLHLVRDRLGIKPLYYGHVGSDLVFASELKAIRQYPGFAADVDRNALALFMRHNYVPTPHCIYKGLHKVKPGCLLSFTSAGATPRITSFWTANEVARSGVSNQLQSSEQEAVDQLHRLLFESVRLRMVSDVPLGAFLSGGVDSSTVVALMQAQSNRPIKTFTIGFYEDQYNEAAHAKMVAAHLGTDHTELYLTPKDALDVVPQLPYMYDEPFSDSSQLPTHLVSKLARKDVTVSLSGDGGDELFGGYSRYSFLERILNTFRILPLPVRNLAGALLRIIPPQHIDLIVGALRPLVPERLRFSNPGDKAHKVADFISLRTPADLYYQALSHWNCPDEIVIGASEPDTIRLAIAESSRGATFEQMMMLTDLVNYLPDDILTKLDRASMAVSLEARVPLLDHRVVEFAWTLPAHLRNRDRKSKWILRKVLYKYVPSHLVDRPKMGFGVPIDRWLRGPLRDWAESLLNERRLRDEGYFDAPRIRHAWREHLAGRGFWQYRLWDVLMFQSWLQARPSKPTFECFSISSTVSA